MSIEERLARMEKNLEGLAAVQDQMMDLLGFTMEGERRLATRSERTEQTVTGIGEKLSELTDKMAETDGKLNALIGVVDGLVRRG